MLDDDSIITGKIIHSNSNFIYVIEEENKLSQYPIDKITTYEISKTKDIKEKSITEKEIEVIENEQLPDINVNQ